MDLNKVMVIGRLTRDPELKTIPSGASVCHLGVATGYVYTNPQTQAKVESTEFHNVVMWRKLGEIAAQYLKKGARVYIEGRLQTRSWDGQDGQKRYRTEIIADNMIMLGDRPAGSNPSAGGYTRPTQPQSTPSTPPMQEFSSPAPREEELPTIDQSMDEGVRVEDIPF